MQLQRRSASLVQRWEAVRWQQVEPDIWLELERAELRWQSQRR